MKEKYNYVYNNNNKQYKGVGLTPKEKFGKKG